jgi:hypothetical protein
MPKRRYRASFHDPDLLWESSVATDRRRPGEAIVKLASEDGWIAEQRVVEQSGQLVVAELRIFFDPDEALPAGGLTARRVRSVTLQNHLETLRDVLQSSSRSRGDPPILVEGFSSAVLRRARAGRRGLPERHYAEVASAYVDALASGSKRPVAELAKEYHVSYSRMADQIHEARSRGLLTRSAPGRAGGELTEKAKKFLAEPKPSASRSQRRKRG